jgi:hypothetical protein
LRLFQGGECKRQSTGGTLVCGELPERADAMFGRGGTRFGSRIGEAWSRRLGGLRRTRKWRKRGEHDGRNDESAHAILVLPGELL